MLTKSNDTNEWCIKQIRSSITEPSYIATNDTYDGSMVWYVNDGYVVYYILYNIHDYNIW